MHVTLQEPLYYTFLQMEEARQAGTDRGKHRAGGGREVHLVNAHHTLDPSFYTLHYIFADGGGAASRHRPAGRQHSAGGGREVHLS